jgi:hypothetical protein
MIGMFISRPFKTKEAVVRETPAALATSSIRTRSRGIARQSPEESISVNR